jgi:hypothetical protein
VIITMHTVHHLLHHANSESWSAIGRLGRKLVGLLRSESWA